MKNVIQQAIESVNTKYVTNTKLRGGTEINNEKLSFTLAETLTTLRSKMFSFGKGTVFMAETSAPISEHDLTNELLTLNEGTYGYGELDLFISEIKGFIYQLQDFVVMIEPRTNSHIVENIYVSLDPFQSEETEGRYLPLIKRAVLLYEITNNVTGLHLKEALEQAKTPEGILALEELAKKLEPKLFQPPLYPESNHPSHWQAIQVEDFDVDSEVFFDEKTTLSPFIPLQGKQKEGYIYEKDGVTLFLDYNYETKEVDQIIRSRYDHPPHFLLQALLLLSLTEGLSPSISQTVERIFTIEKTIEHDTKEANLLVESVLELEKMLTAIHVSHVIEMKEIKTETLQNTTPTLLSFSVEEDEEDDDLFEEFMENDHTSDFETSSPINETQEEKEEEVAREAELEEKEEQKEETLPEVSSLNTRNLQTTHPRFFDDSWVKPYLMEFDLDSTFINKVLKFRKQNRDHFLSQKNEKLISLVPDKAIFAGDAKTLKKALAAPMTKQHVILKGDAGIGKTTLTESVACILNWPLRTVNCSNDTDKETLIGIRTIENKEIVFLTGPVLNAMMEGSVLYLDEMNQARANVMALLNGPLDHRGSIQVEATGEFIKAHPNFRMIASVNMGYTDTNTMNEATIDRPVAIECPPLNREQCMKLLTNFDPGYTEFEREILGMDDVSAPDITVLVNIASILQDAKREELIPASAASTRNILSLLQLSRLLSWKEAVELIVDKYPEEDRDNIWNALAKERKLGIDRIDDIRNAS